MQPKDDYVIVSRGVAERAGRLGMTVTNGSYSTGWIISAAFTAIALFWLCLGGDDIVRAMRQQPVIDLDEVLMSTNVIFLFFAIALGPPCWYLAKHVMPNRPLGIRMTVGTVCIIAAYVGFAMLWWHVVHIIAGPPPCVPYPYGI